MSTLMYVIAAVIGRPGGGAWMPGERVSAEDLGDVESLQKRGLILPDGSPVPFAPEPGSGQLLEDPLGQLQAQLSAALTRAHFAEEQLQARQPAPGPTAEEETLRSDLDAMKTRAESAESKNQELQASIAALDQAKTAAETQATEAEARATEAEEAIKPFMSRNEDLANQAAALAAELDGLYATIDAIIPTTDRGLDALTVDQLRVILRHKSIDVAEGAAKADLIAAVRAAVQTPAQGS